MWYSNLDEKYLFLDIFCTNIDMLVPSLYQCVEPRSIEVFWLLSQLLPHLRFCLFVFSEMFAIHLWTSLREKKLLTVNRKHFFYEYPLHWVLCPLKTHNRTLLFGNTPQAWSPFWLLKPASEHAHRLPRLSWSWTMLLPSDTHRNPITSITAVLLSFLTYLLTLPRIPHAGLPVLR
jgi:hypothetical protein